MFVTDGQGRGYRGRGRGNARYHYMTERDNTCK